MVAFPVEITNPQPETWSAPTVATLIIAGFALLVSLVSAAFNIWSWKAQGINGRLKIFPMIGFGVGGEPCIYLSLVNTGRMPLPILLTGMGLKRTAYIRNRVLKVLGLEQSKYMRDVDFKSLAGRGEFPSMKEINSRPRPKIEPAEDMAGPITVAEIKDYCYENNISLSQLEFAVTTSVKDFHTRIPRSLRKEIERLPEANPRQ